MKFKITRKLNNYKEDKLIIQVKKWWYFNWRDLYWCKEEFDGDEFYQVEFPIDQYLQAKEYINECVNNPDKFYTIIPLLGIACKL